jgi:hypothetical protein
MGLSARTLLRYDEIKPSSLRLLNNPGAHLIT